MRKILKYVVVSLALVTLVVLALAVAGRVKIAWSSNGQFSLNPNICSQQQIKKLNEISSTGVITAQDIKPLYDSVIKLGGYKNDANCVYIAAVYAMVVSDKKVLAEQYDRLANLSNRGHGVSLAFDELYTLKELKTANDSLQNGKAPQPGE